VTAEFHHNYGLTLRRLGRLNDAITEFERAVAARASYPAAWSNLGATLEEADRLEPALAAYQRALGLDTGNPLTHFRVGNVLFRMGRLDDAAAAYRKAIARDAGFAPAHDSLGIVLVAQGRAAQAIACHRTAVAKAPERAAFHTNLGAALAASGDADAAADAYQAALARDPNHADTWHNIGELARSRGRWDEADAAYSRALTADARHDKARFARGLLRLGLGRFAEGWNDYRARAMPAARAKLHREPLPVALSGKRIHARWDQGLGDEIFFLRFLPALRARGAWVAYEPDARLGAMLIRAGIADRIIAPGERIDDADYHIAIGDLPHLLGVTDTPPAIQLTPLPDRVAQMRAALGSGPWLGVTWRAGTAAKSGALFKEVAHEALARALSGYRGSVVAVQRRPADGEVAAFAAALGRPVVDLSAANEDLETTLALMGLLDDYVCVSNTNVHLRAAQGRHSRVLVPHPPEFRWLVEGKASPWFPGDRVYRQSPDGAWQPALARLTAELG
jgi:tetratricopeptide (TPR) repeat protein